MLKNRLLPYISFAVCLFAVAGCTSFDHLTALPEDNSHGPRASECGACHITQYQEWSLSAHAGSFQNPGFQAMLSDGDDDCLSCHAPLNVRGGDPVPRSFNQQEGITCISCHLSQGVMHGPHPSSALFQPHPVQENDSFYRGNGICAVCHQETNDEYQVAADRKKVVTCLECHGASSRHTVTQGSNIFSNTLVAFEDEVETRSHRIGLAALGISPDVLQLTVPVRHSTDKGVQVEVKIENQLPHSLPTGTFGDKSIRLNLRLLQADRLLEEKTVTVADGEQAIEAGDSTTVKVDFGGLPENGDTLELSLQRYPADDSPRPAVILAEKILSLPVEETR